MGILTEWITEWLKGLLIEGIMGNLTGLFDTVNTRVGEIAVQVGTTPAAWNAGVFSLIRQISETVILPIAGLILTFVATYELIQMLIDRNNLHDIDTWLFFKWIFKTAAAILILSNTFNIVNAVFDVSQSVIARSAGVIQGSTDITPDMLATLETTLEGMSLGSLVGLFMQSMLIHSTMWALNIIIFVLVYGRMLEIYMLTSLAPIPVATLSNREVGQMGQNYLKSLFAVGFQGLLILLCVGIYGVLVQGISTSGDPIGAIWGCVGYTVLLCFMLFKTGSISKSVSLAHIRKGRDYGRYFRFGTECPEVPGGTFPHGRDRGAAVLTPSFGGYAFDRSALWHDPELLGCAFAAGCAVGGGALGGQARRCGPVLRSMPL